MNRTALFVIVFTLSCFGCQKENPINSVRDKPWNPLKLPLVSATPSEPTGTAAEDDTIHVDLSGTTLRLVNSSGGSVIASNKKLIVVPDWNIIAWPQSNPKGRVDVTSLDWRLYVTTNWRMDMHCNKGEEGSSVHRYVLRQVKFDGEPFVAWADPSTDRKYPCQGEVSSLSFHDMGSVWQRGDGTTFARGGTMKFINGQSHCTTRERLRRRNCSSRTTRFPSVRPASHAIPRGWRVL